MTCIGARYLLFGGFDGKSTFGDLWWLVPEGCVQRFVNLQSFSALIGSVLFMSCFQMKKHDSIAKRLLSAPPDILESKSVTPLSGSPQTLPKESQTEQAPILELQKRLEISISSSKAQVNLIDEMEDKELHELSSRHFVTTGKNLQKVQYNYRS
ncbi:putative protein GLUTELIN PRECURSOR ACCUMULATION 3 [Cocos nucifera]|nr:putative protein GLUTELIN PRECURSOR ACCUMULATION 3 [Cocos nucifera]